MRRKLIGIFLLALLLRLALLLAWYTDDLSRFQTGDYALYDIGAAHFAQNINFDNSLFLVRPPLFPLVVYLLGGDENVVLLFDIVCGALIAPLAYLLARQFGSADRFAVAAGIIVALDPGSIAHSAFLGPEPLANLLLLAGLLVLLASLNQPTGTQMLVWGLGAGGLLALSSLARPATYLLWLVLGVWLLLVRRSAWRAVAACALVNLLAIGAWTYHNAVHFGNPTFSTVGAYALVYYRAASVERIATGGSDMEVIYTRLNQRVEALLGRNPALADAGTRHGYLAATPEITRALQTVAGEIILAYPHIYLATFPVALARMYGLVPDVSKFDGLLIWIDTGWNWLLVLGTAAGLWLAYRRKERLLLWCCLLVGAYYTAGITIVKSAGLDTRERSMLTPLMALLCVYAAQTLWLRWRSRRQNEGSPAAPVLS